MTAAAAAAAAAYADAADAAAATATAADAADAAAYAAAAAAYAAAAAAYAAAATVWEAVSADCEWMEVQRAGGRLIDRPLWLVDVRGERKYGANLPRWVRAPLDAFASSETGRGRSWKLIVDWYRAIIPNRRDGAPRSLFGEEADIAIATQPDALWTVTEERGADRIMDEVAEIAELAALGSLPQYPIGNSWRESDKRLLVLDQRGTISDAESAGTPVVIQLHEGIKRRIRDFSPVAARVEDEHGWENFASSFQRLSATLVCETHEIPLRIGMAYDAAIEFASFLDQDNELRKRPKGNMSCLDPERRRAFENIVIAVAPWIRRFPTAREIDDEAGSYLGHVPDRLLAIEIAHSARGAELISDADRQLLVDILSVLKERGHLSGKAAVRGAFTAKNLIIAAASLVASFYTGAVASDFSTRSEIVNRASDFLVRSERQILEYMADGPEDLRNSMRILLERIGGDPDQRRSLPGPGLTSFGARREEDGRKPEA